MIQMQIINHGGSAGMAGNVKRALGTEKNTSLVFDIRADTCYDIIMIGKGDT